MASEERKLDVLISSADPTKIPDGNPPYLLQTAIGCSLDDFYFTLPVMLCVLFEFQSHKMSVEEYHRYWTTLQAPKDSNATIQNLKFDNIQSVK